MSTQPAHDERAEMLTAYLDGELTDAEISRLEADLEGDAQLRAELDALAGVRAFLGRHGAVAAPAGFLEGVLAAVDDEPVVQLAWYRRPFGVPVEALAVAAAALLVIWVALPSGERVAPVAGDAAPAAARMEKEASASSASTTSGPPVASQGAYDGIAEGIDPTMNAWEPAKAAEQDAPAPMSKGSSKLGLSKGLKVPLEQLDLVESKSKPVADAEPVAVAPLTEGSFAQVPYSYSVSTDDPQALYRLAALAARYRGDVTDTSKAPLQVEELTSADAATVFVRLPAHALQDFARDIGSIGSVSMKADNSMFAGDPVEVRVSVRLAAGAPGTGDAPVRGSTRKQAVEADLTTEDAR